MTAAKAIPSSTPAMLERNQIHKRELVGRVQWGQKLASAGIFCEQYRQVLNDIKFTFDMAKQVFRTLDSI